MGDQICLADPADLPAAWIELGRHPHFAAATRCFAANMLRLCDEDRRLAAVFKDAGRYVAAMSAAYLHGAGGLTVPLLKQICASTGFLSPGRARAIVDFLLHIDYLEPDGAAAREIRYRPTDRFLSAWRRHLQVAIEAAALIEPSLTPLPQQLEEPESFEALLAIQAARLYALTRSCDPFPGLRRAFLHPYAGSQILWALTLADAEETVPRTGAIRLSLSGLSDRFGVTHLHVRRLLKRAQDEGFIVYHGHGRLSFEPAGASMIALHYAFQLSELVESGRQALARLQAGSQPGEGEHLSG